MQEGMPNNDNGILLTGATGFLGGEILARLVDRGDAPVYALVRAKTDEEAANRLAGVLRGLMGPEPAATRRVHAIAADLEQANLGVSSARRAWLAERVSTILHCAASVSFSLGLEESRRINVDGTERMLGFAELAQRHGGLESYVQISTAYVAGDHDGDFSEDDLDVGQSFRNTYEQSKYEAELAVWERADTLPVQVVRPSIVVGDSRTGWTSAFNVLYSPLRAYSKGAFMAIPARRSAPVDVVPVDFVAAAVLALADRPHTTFHLTAGPRATSVQELLELASAHFDMPPPRVISPTVYRATVHPLLVRTGSERRRRALTRSEVFFPYFDMRVRYDNAATVAALREHDIAVPPLATYFPKLMEFADASRWGKRSVARAGARLRVPITA